MEKIAFLCRIFFRSTITDLSTPARNKGFQLMLRASSFIYRAYLAYMHIPSWKPHMFRRHFHPSSFLSLYFSLHYWNKYSGIKGGKWNSEDWWARHKVAWSQDPLHCDHLYLHSAPLKEIPVEAWVTRTVSTQSEGNHVQFLPLTHTPVFLSLPLLFI